MLDCLGHIKRGVLINLEPSAEATATLPWKNFILNSKPDSWKFIHVF